MLTFQSAEKLWNLSVCLIFILFGYIHYLCFKIDPDSLSKHFGPVEILTLLLARFKQV
jgi:hypothetical protein